MESWSKISEVIKMIRIRIKFNYQELIVINFASNLLVIQQVKIRLDLCEKLDYRRSIRRLSLYRTVERNEMRILIYRSSKPFVSL